jgi:hypothetical membrane protein
MQISKIKMKFYLLSFLGFVIIASVLIIGSFMGIYGKRFDEVPRYKNYIFNICIILSGFYLWYYIKYAFKHDSELTKKKKRTKE